ncbi:VanZ family protein [Maribacter sp. CXY002]|uniref:VanZ family protein n=1 Tax=Maribacter luteocoastalis TaxID=3407671 RepID=UPI003B66F921
MLKNIIFRILFIGWLVFVTFSSLFSFSGVDATELNVPNLDKLVHFTFYFGMVFLGTLAIKEHLGKQFKLAKTLFTMVLLSILYGIIIELVQYSFTENRQGDFFDAIANTVGALVGMFVAKYLISRSWPLK